MSVFELWGPLLFGGRLVVVDRDVAREPNQLVALLAAEGVTVFSQTPSAFYQYVEAAERTVAASSIRYVILAGEAVSFEQMRRWYRSFPASATVVVNMYGITETTVHTTFRALNAELVESTDASDVGDGLPALTVHVLDERLKHTPDGVPGEIYVSGPQVTRGYQNRSDLTAVRFVADPFSDAGDRMYRSGDMAIRRGDTIEYLGRSDGQVQLRGFRVEMGEVEAGMLRVDEVSGAAATVTKAASGDDLLVGYVVPVDGAVIDSVALRSAIGAHVPAYMVPDVIVELDQLPLTVNGKLDRRSLPEPQLGTQEFVAPETDAERRIAAEFAAVLGVDTLSATASFFDLGGNSLAAARIVGRVGEALDVELSVRDLFDAPTVRDLAAAVVGHAPALPPIVAVTPRPDTIPLSFAQQRMWLVNRRAPESAAYNIPAVLTVTGDLDHAALREAVVDVVIRQAALRTRFPAVAGTPVQQIASPDSVAGDLDWSTADSTDEITAVLGAGFDVTAELPVRGRVVEIGPGEHVVAIVMHHIAADGESVGPFVADLLTAYRARKNGQEPEFAPLDVQFADFALWEHRALGAPDEPESASARQLAYWRERLSGLPSVQNLPIDRPRAAVASGRSGRVDFVIDDDLARRVDATAAASSASAFMVVHAALAVVLARITGDDDVAVGTPIAGRGQAVLDPLVGMFVNTLILRSETPSDAPFRDVLETVKSSDLDAFANADVPFEYVVDAVDAERSPSFAPLSQVWLTLDESSVRGALSDAVEGLTIEPAPINDAPAKVDLFVRVERADAGAWRGELIYAADLFDEQTVSNFATWLVDVLDACTSDVTTVVGDVRFTATARAGSSDTADVPTPAISLPAQIDNGGLGAEPVLLRDMFAAAASTWGPRSAVVDPDGSVLTYAQLDARSNALARRLLALGARPETLVALAIGRSATLLTAIWAVAKTGAGYVPIDPDYPAERVAAMIEDSGAHLGLTVRTAGTLPTTGFDWTEIDSLESPTDDTSALTDAELLGPTRVDNVAYVIYTSGSTGRPKGVSVTHSGLKNFAEEEARRSSADEYSRILGFASPSFDASVLEYLLATVSGGTLVYRPSDAVGGPVLAELMLRSAVTHTFLTPTVLSTLDPLALPALRVIYAGGEAVPQALKDAWTPFRRVQNLYGPTETTIGVAIGEPMAVGEPVTLGGPIAGIGFAVLDGRLRQVPDGVVGELYVCGPALSRGYLDRPGLTADRFVANPFLVGDRMYRTGDLVRWRTDSAGRRVLDYSGRSDDQVKLRGLRIELGEIEAVLAEHPDVTSAVVVGVGSGSGDTGGESVTTALAGYVVVGAGCSVEGSELRRFVADRLPAHMVPASITLLDALPPVTPVSPRPDRIPLSYAQQRMWFINRFDPTAPTYNVPAVIRLTGPLHVDALSGAFTDVIARHEALRTRFPDDDGVPFQSVSSDPTPDWAVSDDQSALETDLARGFDLRTDRPIRARLVSIGRDQHILAIVAHHIVADGESLGPLVSDLLTAYGARAQGQAPDFAPLPVQFADVALWERAVLGDPADEGSIIAGQLDHWRTTLAGLPAVTDLPSDRPRPELASGRGDAVDFTVPADVVHAVESLASARGATPFMILHAALAVLIARLSATTDIA
ncbi:MAG: amino acid adenylation domain-containing protein, partial [Gordonia sp. (in: high G+C Gram-positive bacteria)]|nr:amino acid adenylation domain-containing protein [Gordonia sp. (in: high G+C Gram-positive bacteria)]